MTGASLFLTLERVSKRSGSCDGNTTSEACWCVSCLGVCRLFPFARALVGGCVYTIAGKRTDPDGDKPGVSCHFATPFPPLPSQPPRPLHPSSIAPRHPREQLQLQLKQPPQSRDTPSPHTHSFISASKAHPTYCLTSVAQGRVVLDTQTDHRRPSHTGRPAWACSSERRRASSQNRRDQSTTRRAHPQAAVLRPRATADELERTMEVTTMTTDRQRDGTEERHPRTDRLRLQAATAAMAITVRNSSSISNLTATDSAGARAPR